MLQWISSFFLQQPYLVWQVKCVTVAFETDEVLLCVHESLTFEAEAQWGLFTTAAAAAGGLSHIRQLPSSSPCDISQSIRQSSGREVGCGRRMPRIRREGGRADREMPVSLIASGNHHSYSWRRSGAWRRETSY